MTRTRAGCLLWAALWVQDPPGSTPPKFPAQVDLITVDTVVVDKKGNPVAGLTRDDFVLKEDGQIREIVAFEAVSVPRPSAPAAAAPPPPPPHIATSAPAAARTGSTFLVVFDDLHLTGLSAAGARAGLGRFLHESANEGDQVVMVSTATGTAWRGTLPADRDDLLAFAAGLGGRLPAQEVMTEHESQRIAEYGDRDVLQRVVGRYLSMAICAPPPFDCDSHVRADARTNHERGRVRRRASLELMQRSVEGLAAVRGRKTVLMLSQGFIHDGSEDAYRRLVAASQRTYAAVYFVDARGLEALPDSASAAAAPDVGLTLPHQLWRVDTERMPMIVAARQALGRSSSERFLRVQDVGVETMADETGGFGVRNTNDLAAGLDRAAKESRQYYLLGFAPTPAPAGAFRPIEVRVAREGLTVRARKGYEARDPLVPSAATPAEVPLRLATYVVAPAGEKTTRVAAVTEIETSGLAFADRDGRRVAQLEFRAEAVARDGGQSYVQQATLEIGAPGPEAARERWNTARLEFALPPGVFRVQASVREAASGRTGVVTQRLERRGADPLRRLHADALRRRDARLRRPASGAGARRARGLHERPPAGLRGDGLGRGEGSGHGPAGREPALRPQGRLRPHGRRFPGDARSAGGRRRPAASHHAAHPGAPRGRIRDGADDGGPPGGP